MHRTDKNKTQSIWLTCFVWLRLKRRQCYRSRHKHWTDLTHRTNWIVQMYLEYEATVRINRSPKEPTAASNIAICLFYEMHTGNDRTVKRTSEEGTVRGVFYGLWERIGRKGHVRRAYKNIILHTVYSLTHSRIEAIRIGMLSSPPVYMDGGIDTWKCVNVWMYMCVCVRIWCMRMMACISDFGISYTDVTYTLKSTVDGFERSKQIENQQMAMPGAKPSQRWTNMYELQTVDFRRCLYAYKIRDWTQGWRIFMHFFNYLLNSWAYFL